MLILVALAPPASAGPAGAHATATDLDLHVDVDPPVSPVVDGRQVDRGSWEDAVGLVMFDYYVGCTGTLIGPRVVLTAGHCVNGYPVTSVIVGSTDWATGQGEVIDVVEVHEYPDSQDTYDIGLLILAEKSSYAPRAIGLDCIVKDYLKDGEKVRMVGYGVTDADGSNQNTKLNQGVTTIKDRNCDETFIDDRLVGCRDAVSPGGELAGGGDDGPSVCYGDSGGPLYLETERGAFVVGVASRLYLGSDYGSPCDDGSIWVRPDAVIDWIEETAGGREIVYPSCNEPPSLGSAEIETWKDRPGSTVLQVLDPDGDAGEVLVEIVEQPVHGTAVVDGFEIVYTPAEAYVGPDEITVAVTDAGTGEPRTGGPVTVEVSVPVMVNKGIPPVSCGCGTSGPEGLGGLLAAGLLALGRRVRPRASRRG